MKRALSACIGPDKIAIGSARDSPQLPLAKITDFSSGGCKKSIWR
jgi:hypothetical protein